MKLLKTPGASSQIWQVFIADSSSSTGAGLTGLAYNSGSLTAYYHRSTDTTATAISLVTMTVGTFTSSGFKEIDSTNMPGWYQFCPPDAALAWGAESCAFMLKGATNMAPLSLEVQLESTAFGVADKGTLQSATGTTAVLRSTSSATDSTFVGHTLMIVSGTGAGQSRLVTAYTGSSKTCTVDTWTTTPDSTSVYVLIGTPPASTAAPLTALISSGTGAGQLDVTSGVIKANLAQILGTALTETAGYLAAGFKKFFNIAAPASTMDHLTLIDTVTTATTATNLTNAPTNGDLTAAMKTSVTTAASAATPVATLSGDLTSTMKTSVTTAASAATPVATLSGDLTSTMKTSVQTAATAATPTAAAVTGAVGSVTAGVTVTTNNDKTGYRLDATGSAALTEGYAPRGTTGTLPQLLYSVLQALTEFTTSGTTITVKKRDHSTTAFTETVDSATTPTSITQAT